MHILQNAAKGNAIVLERVQFHTWIRPDTLLQTHQSRDGSPAW